MKRDTTVEEAKRAFANHAAVGRDCGGLYVLTWSRPNDSTYAMRFVFDREANTVTISGDLYDCVFRPTCPCDLKSVATCFTYYDKDGVLQVNEPYFLEKVSAGNNLYCYSADDACEYVTRRWDERYGSGEDADSGEDDDDRRDRGDMDDLLAEIESAVDYTRGIDLSPEIREALSEIDGDWWEWAYDLGKRFSLRVTWWLVGLRMAYDQMTKGGEK